MMHPLVRDLYKRILVIGRDHPLGLSRVRVKAKVAIMEKKELPIDSLLWKKAIKDGRWHVQEMIAVIQFKKYRAMKGRYSSPSDTSTT